MLNREEYNLAFKTTLSQEEFDEIMGKPITDLSEVEELVFADRKGNVWRFLPAANAIPIEWLEKCKDRYILCCTIIDDIIEEWREERGRAADVRKDNSIV